MYLQTGSSKQKFFVFRERFPSEQMSITQERVAVRHASIYRYLTCRIEGLKPFRQQQEELSLIKNMTQFYMYMFQSNQQHPSSWLLSLFPSVKVNLLVSDTHTFNLQLLVHELGFYIICNST